ncbi:MAG: hypothetical protein ACI39W_04295 [Brotaphodocola sp.]
MPYCPKCDMEFIDGITRCTDCGGPLLESKEVADAMKKREKEKEIAIQRAQYEAMQAAMAEQAAMAKQQAQQAAANGEPIPAPVQRRQPKSSHAYINKAQKYEDLKSSATAFYLVGGVMTAACILLWTGIVNLPMYGFGKYLTEGVLTIMGVGMLIVAVKTSQSLKEFKGEINDDQKETKEIVEWFAKTFSPEKIDRAIIHDFGELEPEDLSLKRFYIIHDLLITHKDLPNEDYVDMLCEEIYNKIYES